MKNKEFKKLKNGDKLKCKFFTSVCIFERYDKILQKVYLGGANEGFSPVNKKFFMRDFELIKQGA